MNEVNPARIKILGFVAIFVSITLLTLGLSFANKISFGEPAYSENSELKNESDATPEIKTDTDSLYVQKGFEKAIAKRVVDGDTIELSDGRTVRYIGIDTPETVAPGRPIECFGKEASKYNKSLVEGKEVFLEKDTSDVDRYGRLLRYVYVSGVMVNEVLTREGYASAKSYPPDVKHQDVLEIAESSAREGAIGLWDRCD